MTIPQQIRRALFRLLKYVQWQAWDEARREIALIRKLLCKLCRIQSVSSRNENTQE